MKRLKSLFFIITGLLWAGAAQDMNAAGQNLPPTIAHADTLQYLSEMETEDFSRLILFLAKGNDTLRMTAYEDEIVPKLLSPGNMYFVEWENMTIQSGGDSEVFYNIGSIKNCVKIDVEPFREAITEDEFIRDINSLPEVMDITGGNPDLYYIDSEPSEERPYYVVQISHYLSDNFMPLLWFHVYVDPYYEIRYYDIADERELSLEQWRKN